MLSIVKPRIVKVSSHVIPKSGHKVSYLLVFCPIGMTTVLSRLQARPEMLWNCVIYFVVFLKLVSFRSRNIVVSSAKVSLRDSFSAKVMPVIFLPSSVPASA